MKTANINIQGMHCAGCAGKVEKALAATAGVAGASVSLALSRAKVNYNESQISADEIVAIIRRFGYGAQYIPTGFSVARQAEGIQLRDGQERRRYKKTFQLSALLTLPLVLFMAFPGVHGFLLLVLQAALAGIVQVVGGGMFYRSAWYDLKNKTIGMDVLVAAATTIAYLFSLYSAFSNGRMAHAYFETPALLVSFVLFGKWLESKARSDASASLLKLMAGAAPKAGIMDDNGRVFEIDASMLLPGDEYILRAGTVVPADGVVLEGSALFDESMLSGEALPVSKDRGAAVYSGTMDNDGFVRVRVTAPASDSTLARIVGALAEAQNSRPRLQKTADKIAAVFSLVVALLAVITFLLWFRDGAGTALMRSVAVMVAACPCAIGLATPLAVMAATGRLLNNGIIIREGEALERAAAVDVVMFDKTGTLTDRNLVVSDIHFYGDEPEGFIKDLAAAFGVVSSHPLAKALAGVGTGSIRLQDVSETAGQGMSASINGRRFYLGSYSFVCSKVTSVSGIMPEDAKVFLADGTSLLAGFSFAEKLSGQAGSLIAFLKKRGIEPVIVSGDSETAVRKIAAASGIDCVYFSCSPQGKAEVVEEFRKNGKVVAICGDGINDAIALKKADVGIAVSGGTDVAKLSADVNFLHTGLSSVVVFLLISKKVMRNIRQNLFWALIYNIIMLPLAMFSDINPVYCGLAMSLSSVSVALNAVRLRFVSL